MKKYNQGFFKNSHALRKFYFSRNFQPDQSLTTRTKPICSTLFHLKSRSNYFLKFFLTLIRVKRTFSKNIFSQKFLRDFFFFGKWLKLSLTLSLRDPKLEGCARGRVDRVEKSLFLILLYIPNKRQNSMGESQKGRGKNNSRGGEGMSYASVVCVNIQKEEKNLLCLKSCKRGSYKWKT